MGETPTVEPGKTIETRKRGVRFTKSEFTDAQKLNGVMLYLYDKGYTNPEHAHNIIKEFGVSIGHTPTAKGSIQKIAVKIQDNFPTFTTWFKQSSYAIRPENTARESGA